MSRRAENKKVNRQRILDAAMREFSTRGFNATGMDAIAGRAELSKPTLYQYFSSKEDLFKAVLTEPRDQMLVGFDQNQDVHHVDTLYRFARTYASIVMQPKYLSLARLVIGEAQRFPEIGRAYQAEGPDKVLAALKNFMQLQLHSGKITGESAEFAAQDFWGLILSAPRNAALHDPENLPDDGDVQRSIENGIHVFLKAYSVNPEQDVRRFNDLL